MARDIKKEIQETLDYLPYNSDQIHFYKENKKYFGLLGFKGPKISPKKILLAYCLRNIKESTKTKIMNVEEVKFRKNKLIHSLDSFIKRFNLVAKRTSMRLGDPWIAKVKSEDAFLIYLPRINTSYTQKKTKTKANYLNTNRGFFSGLYISKKDKKIYYFRMSKFVYNWVKWFLKAKLKVKFESPKVKKYTPKLLNQLINGKLIKIFRIEVKYPEIDESDSIIINSKKGTAQNYQKKISSALNITKKIPSVYDIGYIILSYNGQQKIKIKFQRKKDYYINFECNYIYERQVPPKILPYMGENVLLTDKVNEKSLLNAMIQREYMDKFDYNNPYLRPLIDNLEKIKLISIKPSIRYYCINPSCPFTIENKQPSENPKCACGTLSDNKEINYYGISINEDKMKKLLSQGFKKIGFGKYKTMPKNYLGFKNSLIIRIEDQGKYLFILVNKKGLDDKEIENLRLLGIPFFIINLKGETNSTMEGFGSITSAELMISILKDDFKNIKSIIDQAKTHSNIIRQKSFDEALKKIKKRSINPLTFERAVFSLLNYIFPECQKWGGPKLPDGSFPFNGNKIKYLLWDAKRYNTSSLLKYVKDKAVKKDIRYMIKFNNNKIIKKFGSVKYYLFVTSNTKKDEFLSVKRELKKQIETSKRKPKLKGIKVICINKDNLKKLAEYFNKNQIKITEKHHNFINMFREELTQNEGYLNFRLFKPKIDILISQEVTYPNESEIRKNS
jgi:hypothetical protein